MFEAGAARGLVAAAAALCLGTPSVGLVLRADDKEPTTVAATGHGHTAHTTTSGANGGGWEQHRPTTTSPTNHRPPIPPGHNKPTTTTRPVTTTTTKHTTTTITHHPTTTTTTTTTPPCWWSAPDVVTAPSDYVPQCTVLDIYPAYGFIGPLSPNDPNMRPFDFPIRNGGATRGYARTWLATQGPGGYTVYAWEFADNAAAKAARSAAYGSFVGDFGGVPFAVHDGVVAALVLGDAARAYWVQGRYLRIVDLSTQFARDVDPTQAKADMHTIVEGLLAIDARGCCD
jgi:hypothetical protein